VGVDSRPLRIFNPVLQSRRYDPEGRYIRQWLPELEHLDTDALHEPWLRPEARRRGYPAPIVQHEERRRRFEEIYAKLTAAGSP
ncbi:MAG: FAD-binding domain-containing protein, partial [Aquificaceae bacterium]|nr:FAD-binding domain-containing protein [Aquificaceae bacterium]